MIPPACGVPPRRALREAAELVAGGLLGRNDDGLANTLYARWYTGWLGPDGLPHVDAAEPAAAATPGVALVRGSARDLAAALRAAHVGARCFEPGWRARQVSSTGRVVASRGVETRVLDTVDYVASGRVGLPPRVDGEIAAVRRRDSLDASPGFWLTFGAGWPQDGAVPGLVRMYWNVRGDDAAALVAALTGALDAGPPTWALKLPVDLAQHVRRDAAVVYLPGSDFPAHAPALAGAADALADRLLPEEPPLTLRLVPGVGLAEDPAGDESFGSSRCSLIAEGLAGATGDDVDVLLAAVLDRLRHAGIDPDHPYLEPGSCREYALPAPAATVPEPRRHKAPVRSRQLALPSAESDRFLDGAGAIAGQLVAEAIWHEDRCTWMGDAVVADGESWAVGAQSCNGDVYGGTAGVGLFLARWANAAGDRGAARTALGASRHAVRVARGLGLGSGGLFTGAVGTAWAAMSVADALDDPVLSAVSREFASDAAEAVITTPAGDNDLLGGEAGSIVAVLALADACGGDSPWLEAAGAAARRLLAGATRSGLGWHWPGPGAASPYGLCGLAHGTSGIALAFLLLSARTGDDAYTDAAGRALAYERRWYRGKATGWPDLRERSLTDLALGRGLTYPALWCHGAAGAGLVRLVAFAHDGEAASLAEAGATLQASRVAAAQVLRAVAERPEAPGDSANWSLCHGLMGIAELMVSASTYLREPVHLGAARRLGERALSDRAAFGAWRCGVRSGGETPGLFLGLAGIGTTLLRLHDPGLAPSPVLAGVGDRGAGVERRHRR